MSNESNDGGRLERAGANATAQGKNASNGTATVTVGCKLPHGLILDLTVAGQPARRFRVAGMNSRSVIGGFGITPGVPKDFWEAWLERNQAIDFVQKGLIFALGKTDSARDRAKDCAELRNDFEPLDISNNKNPDAKPGVIETVEPVAA